MRYSYYVYLNHMGDTLVEVADYLQSPDASAGTLMDDCRKLFRAIEKTLSQQSADAFRDKEVLQKLDCCKRCFRSDFRGDPSIRLKTAQDLKDSFLNGLNYRFRAVFFAELGEKWDSMRSVYEEFSTHEDCDPVVVLTPIFREVEKNGKKVRETIYKDYLTAMGIPFINYTDYQIQKDCPDVAFTSQPYESCTTPEFWAESIATYTRLVYLPYFAPHMLYSDSREVLTNMPIYKHAWRTIGSGIKHYEYYKRYSECLGQNMLVSGVPKWDETVQLRKCGLSKEERIPEWEALFQGKKVFLWNSFYDIKTSSLHYWDELFLYFKTHPEMVLIWRPHPMTNTVTKMYYNGSSNDFLQKIYSDIETVPNIILDIQTTYRPAYYYSDALISDFSSMMTQYLLMDKPTLWLYHPQWKPTISLIANYWMEKAIDLNDIVAFFNRIGRNIDKNKKLREQVRQQDIPLADGHCGKRVTESVLEAMKIEDGVFTGEYDE